MLRNAGAMPTSNLAVWPDILLAINQVPHQSILDVGPGHGKASILLREYLSETPAVIEAIEAWQPYITRFGLERLYHRVFCGDVTAATWTTGPDEYKWDAAEMLRRYDVVLMGDVIEHIPTDKAMALLGRIPGRVVICTPVDFFNNDPHGVHPHTEQHVSHWTEREWDHVARSIRPLEVRYQVLGGWIIRTAPLQRTGSRPRSCAGGRA